MALPDTAEYWQGVRSHRPYSGAIFYHIPNADCGHRHLHEALKLGDVNCFSCLKMIEAGYEHRLQEGKTDFRSKGQKKRDRKAQLAKEEFAKIWNCTCGHRRVKRMNRESKEYFLACSNYPKCRITSKM